MENLLKRTTVDYKGKKVEGYFAEVRVRTNQKQIKKESQMLNLVPNGVQRFDNGLHPVFIKKSDYIETDNLRKCSHCNKRLPYNRKELWASSRICVKCNTEGIDDFKEKMRYYKNLAKNDTEMKFRKNQTLHEIYHHSIGNNYEYTELEKIWDDMII